MRRCFNSIWSIPAGCPRRGYGGWLPALFLGVGLALVFPACSRTPTPPPPLALEQIPAELQKAYAKAGAETKDVIGEIERTLQSKDYPAAFERVQLLLKMPDGTESQYLAANRAMLSLTTALQKAEAEGNANAGEVLRQRRRTR